MPRMEITTAIGCTNNCSYCPQDVLKKAYSGDLVMSMDTFKKCLDKTPRAVTINFSGMCEPFQNPNCSDMILYAYRKGHEIILYTTLSHADKTDLDIISNIPFKIFAVHLIKKATKGTLDKIRWLNCYIKDIQVFKEGENLKIGSRAGNFPGKLGRVIGPIMCLRSLRCNVLLPNGDVVVCCNDYGLKHKLGNLLEDDYVDLFLSKEFRRLLKGLWDDSEDIICRYCDNFMSRVMDDGRLEQYPKLKANLDGSVRVAPI